MVQNILTYKIDFIYFAIGLCWLFVASIAYFLKNNQRINFWNLTKADLTTFTEEDKRNYIPWNYLMVSAIIGMIAKWSCAINWLVSIDTFNYSINACNVLCFGACFLAYLEYSTINSIRINTKKIIFYIVLLIIPFFINSLFEFTFAWCLLVSIPFIYQIFYRIKINAKNNNIKALNNFVNFLAITCFIELITNILPLLSAYLLNEDNELNKIYILFSAVATIGLVIAAYNLWLYGKKKVIEENYLFYGFWAPCLIIITLIAGLSFRELRIYYQKNIIVQKMVDFSVKVARVLDMENLQPGVNSIEQSAKFDSINKLLYAYKSYNEDYAGLCTVWKNGEDFVFGPESYLPGETLSSPRWSKYLMPPESVAKCFKEKRFIVDSYTDEFSHFMSVLIPLLKKNSDEVYSVMILDIYYDRYLDSIKKEIIACFVVFVFLACFITFCVIIFNSKKQLRQEKGASIVLLPAIVFVFCIGITSIFTYYVNIATVDDNYRYFEDVAKAKSDQILGLFDKLSTDLSGIMSYRSYQKINSYEDFAASLGAIKEYGKSMSFESRRRVKGSDIKSFEAMIRAKPDYSDYEVRVYDRPDGKRLEIDDDMYYWLSEYEYPRNPLNSALGEEYIDYTRRKSIRYMLKTCRPVAITPKATKSRLNNANDQGLVVLLPFDFIDAKHFKSMFVAVVGLQTLLEHFMPLEYFKEDNVCFEIFELDENDGRERQLAAFPKDAHIDSKFQTVIPIFFIDKTLGLRISALEGYYGSEILDNTPTMVVASVGTILSIIISLFIFSLQKHQQNLEKLVENASNRVKNDEKLAQEMTEVLPLIAYQSIYDEKFTPVFLSKYVEHLTGNSISDYMEGKITFADNIFPEDLKTAVNEINNGIAKKGSFAVQYRFIGKDNQIIWMDARGYVGGYDKHGKPTHVNGFLYNITERKKILERLQQILNNLDDANQQLKLRKEKSSAIALEAEEANKKKAEFLAELSHIIRTPMNAIIGGCELLKDSKLAETQNGIAGEIKANSDKLIMILNNILGKSNLELATVDIKKGLKPENKTISGAEPANEGKKKLLVVEDNKTNQKVVLAMLKKLGYTAEVANDGAEALNLLSGKYFDLIFMDCQMPIIDGFEATRRIRKGEGVLDPNVTIVALTANAMASDKAKCFDVGMNDFLSKPVTPKDIAGILEKWL